MALPDFEGWAVFATVAEQRSFSGAAVALGLSKGTVSKAITRLETRLGIALFHRTSRRLTLTDSGAALVARAHDILASAVEAEECAREEAGLPSGLVRLAVPMSFGLAEVGPVVAQFMAEHPAISVELNLSDSRVDLVGDGYDAALRIGALADSSLIARKLRDVRRPIVASPSWVAAHGSPQHPGDVPADALFGYTMSPTSAQLVLTHNDGRETVLKTQGRLRANNGDVMLDALEAGLGIAVAPDFIVASRLADGRLVEVLKEWALPPIGLHLVTPPGRLRPRRVEVLLGFLTNALGK
ncbi:LysR family transcriptional regulator [Sphingomonas sp. SUN039]|uniref:LysR family transcriptional regulator n=1 Tax=Sphingomonas sp. SUN039 TaxID=2937787 RepID=UPI002164D8DB|nr:LysR family transcriptional regulator [Sphingomonas sp. SUN039]UVO54854.1 LysR family transcriptional regulator [Sphingomonas sp. SUN039]